MGFRQDIEQEPVSNLPLRDAILVKPLTVVRAAVAVMRARAIGCAVIVDNHMKPQGIFSERSLLHVLNQYASLDDRPVCEFAEPNFSCFRYCDPIARVWEVIQEHGSRFICVTDDDGKLIGMTGQRGMAEYVSENFPQQVVVQRLGSKPWMQQREGA